MKEFIMAPLGDCALCITFCDSISQETSRLIQAACQAVQATAIPSVQELVPSFCTLLVFYDPMVQRYEPLRQALLQALDNLQGNADFGPVRRVSIPVCYGGEFGPDLPDVAQHVGMTPDEVIRCHSGQDYPVYMLGFLPGFPYLGGLDPRLATPRLAAPRVKVEAGSVGIGGEQTGIYPMSSPGGWRLIGRTPVRLFDPGRTPPVPYSIGDLIRFVPITPEQYRYLERGIAGYRFLIEEV